MKISAVRRSVARRLFGVRAATLVLCCAAAVFMVVIGDPLFSYVMRVTVF